MLTSSFPPWSSFLELQSEMFSETGASSTSLPLHFPTRPKDQLTRRHRNAQTMTCYNFVMVIFETACGD